MPVVLQFSLFLFGAALAVCDHFFRLRLLRLHYRGCDALGGLPIPDTSIGSAFGEGTNSSPSFRALVEAEDHPTPILDRTADRARPPDQFRWIFVQDLRRQNGLPSPS